MFLIVGGEGSSNRNASRDESVEAGDKYVEAGDESIETGEKTPQSCYNFKPSVAINAARIRATRRFRHVDHRNRSGTDFFRAAPRNCVPVDRNFLHMASRCHPD